MTRIEASERRKAGNLAGSNWLVEFMSEGEWVRDYVGSPASACAQAWELDVLHRRKVRITELARAA